MAFDLLSDLVVIEVAHYGPDSLGGRLADLGARVIKVEDPQGGDPVRRGGAYAVGGSDGYSYLHLRWNRGKESVIIDLVSEKGRAEFLALAAKADVVVEGMRAGIMERLGLGFEVLKQANPAIVFCSVSGLHSFPHLQHARFAGRSSPLRRAQHRPHASRPQVPLHHESADKLGG